jgi:hypothetical protein
MVNVWEIDFLAGRSIIQCDSCKASIDLKKPKKGESPNEGIKAVLNSGLDTTKEYHFCDEGCLRDFLNKRAKVQKSKK